MKTKMKPLPLYFLTILALLTANPVFSQDQIGSIRGTVYRDVNANGRCSDEGEVRLGDIPLEVINDDIQEIVRIVTDPDGTFVHSTIDLGEWQVTVVPGPGWRITSQQTQDVVLTEDSPDVAGIDFCIIEIEAEPTPEPAPTPVPAPTPTPEGTVILPESGASISPPLLIAGLGGLLLMLLGAIIILRARFD